MNDPALMRKSIAYRLEVLRVIRQAKAGHTGGSLSCVDILNVLYNRILRVSPETWPDPRRDRYIQSKGHSVEALYVVLADRGFFPAADLETLERAGSPYVGHPTRKVPGIEHNTGALGHGLAFAVGLALAGKQDEAAYRVFALLGDGELAEGSNWESLLSAAHYDLDNLCVIVDRNRLQITGPTRDVCRLEDLAEKFRAFGAAVRGVDGHDVTALTAALTDLPWAPGRPSVLIAETVKGRGVPFMENDASWHHRVPDEAQYATARAALEAQRREIPS